MTQGYHNHVTSLLLAENFFCKSLVFTLPQLSSEQGVIQTMHAISIHCVFICDNTCHNLVCKPHGNLKITELRY